MCYSGRLTGRHYLPFERDRTRARMTILIAILATHFIADFICQTDWMAVNKSVSWKALLIHTAVYSICFSYFGLLFVVITFLFHTATDAITSRITSKLWVANERHWFFVTIGADQLIHYITLFLTYNYLFPHKLVV